MVAVLLVPGTRVRSSILTDMERPGKQQGDKGIRGQGDKGTRGQETRDNGKEVRDKGHRPMDKVQVI